MKPRFVVTGHSLLKESIVKDLMPGIYKRNRAVCSCGAWCDVIPMKSSASQAAANRNWHDEHKINVLRSRGELEEE